MSKYFLVILLIMQGIWVMGQHPSLLVKDVDRENVLEKIEDQPWANSIYQQMVKKVEPYVHRHQSDSNWILDRYLMNWTDGKYYTDAVADSNGTAILSYSGNAPFPTVRYTPHKRPPVSDDGYRYDLPSIEEIQPRDTSHMMALRHPITGQRDTIDLHSYVGRLQDRINDLAKDAAILYWLTQEEKYAKFAADILYQWARGAYFQNPISGPCRVGFLNTQTLGEANSVYLMLAYDFVKPYMKEAGYEMYYFETVFEKIASTLAYRGYSTNNWFAAESYPMVMAALSLEDESKRDEYLAYFLSKDSIFESCGQLALPSMTEKWLTPDGMWKEPGGYHNYPISNVMMASFMLENKGYSIFNKFSSLLDACSVLLKYSFPNLKVSSFGDSRRVFQDPKTLELGILMAQRYDPSRLPFLQSSLKSLMDDDLYDRKSAGFLGLLAYSSEVPAGESENVKWPRSGHLDFAGMYFQRNGSDKKSGLMYVVQGASYNHNHNNGMAMELYGQGRVMGIDPGPGISYDHPIHQGYYAQWAAHNTVVSGGQSSSIPFSGGAGLKEIGKVTLSAMEPLPDSTALSNDYSFSDTRYFDPSTSTNQLRNMSIIRINDSIGFYVDIFRSDYAGRNDYVYHNVGDKVEFLDESRQSITTVQDAYPISGDDRPGFRFFKDVHQVKDFKGSVVTRFGLSDRQYMQVVVPKLADQSFYRGMFPRSHSAEGEYLDLPTPALSIYRNGEAWSKPFVVLYESYVGESKYTVQKMEVVNIGSTVNHTVLAIQCKDEQEYFVFQGNDVNSQYRDAVSSFIGQYGVVNSIKNKVKHLYLGKGKELAYGGYRLLSTSSDNAISLEIESEELMYIASQKASQLILSSKAGFKIKSFSVNGQSTPLTTSIKNGKLTIDIPSGSKGWISLERQ